MNLALQHLVEANGGVIDRSTILAQLPHDVLDRAVRRRELTRVLPGTYVAAPTDHALLRAAARYAGPRGGLSHTTALWRWGMLRTLHRPLHVTVAPGRQPRGSTTVVAHRRYGDLEVIERDGLPVVHLDRALLESAPLLARDTRRWMLIKAVQQRRTTAAMLDAELLRLPKLRGRAELRALIDLLGKGCHSELELFGYAKVFSHPSLPVLESQYRVRLSTRTAYLDLADPALRVAIELAGAEFHDNPDAIERDRRRDVELAALGWVVLRFSARRLREDPAGVRREVRAVLAARQAQLLAS